MAGLTGRPSISRELSQLHSSLVASTNSQLGQFDPFSTTFYDSPRRLQSSGSFYYQVIDWLLISMHAATVLETRTATAMTQTHSPLFLRARAISFSCIIFLSFIWIIILCLCLFAQWDIMDHIERSLLLIMLFIDTITVIMIPILLIQTFRPWLDAARLLFLMLSHAGIAIFFAARMSSFQCVSTDPDRVAVCNLINLFVSVSSWTIPALVVGYSGGLTYYVCRRSKAQPETMPVDIEKQDTKRPESDQSLAKFATFNPETYHAI